MTKAWQQLRRAAKIDMKSRSIFLGRVCPDAHPATNLMAEWIKPSPEDIAEAERYVDDNPWFLEGEPARAPSGITGIAGAMLGWL